ncbi:hypothetical protein DDT46_13965 [Mycobacteroides abscessus]|nr:hypothetical protein DDT46_13965 [Mycobacteroides abscessus]
MSCTRDPGDGLVSHHVVSTLVVAAPVDYPSVLRVSSEQCEPGGCPYVLVQLIESIARAGVGQFFVRRFSADKLIKKITWKPIHI